MMFGKSQIIQITAWFAFMFLLNTSKHLNDRHLAYWTQKHTHAPPHSSTTGERNIFSTESSA